MQIKFWAGLLCILLLVGLAGSVFAQEEQEKPQKQQRQRQSRFRWKGPDIGTQIQDFELPILTGGDFMLSEHKGKIVIIELGACT